MSSAAPSFLARVRDSLQALHPAERKLADFMLDFPGELASYSASELARLADVSNATVTRLIKRLGYQNYDEARRLVREEKQTGSPLFLADRASGIDKLFEAHAEQGQDNLRRTFARLSEQQVAAIAHALLSARKVWVTGFRSSHAIATYFRWQIFQVKEDIHVVPNAGDTLGEYLASIVPQDLVVIFGLRRRPLRLDDIVTQAVASGAPVLYVTDEVVATRGDVRWHIRCACAAPGPLDNHVSVIALCHLLANRVMETSGASGRDRLTAIEAEHDAFGEM
jgi:DNA-binding MurR/RpiR family transcriptional regulator